MIDISKIIVMNKFTKDKVHKAFLVKKIDSELTNQNKQIIEQIHQVNENLA